MRCCPAKRVNLVGALVDEESEEEYLFIGLAAIGGDAEQLTGGGKEQDALRDVVAASGSGESGEQCASSERCAQGVVQRVAVDNIRDLDGEEKETVTQDVCITGDARWTQTVDINGHSVNLKLDTGAGANILNVQDFRALRRRPCLKDTKLRLVDFNRRAIVVQGQCIVSVTIAKGTFNVLFVVVETGPSLLGRTACERLDLVRRILAADREDKEVRDAHNYVLPDNVSEMSAIPFVHKIVVREGSQPVSASSRRVPVAVKGKLKGELERMLRLGVIERVVGATDWVNHMVIVYKPNGDIRLCLDPRALNKSIVR